MCWFHMCRITSSHNRMTLLSKRKWPCAAHRAMVGSSSSQCNEWSLSGPMAFLIGCPLIFCCCLVAHRDGFIRAPGRANKMCFWYSYDKVSDLMYNWVARFQKCSQSGKNGSNHPMLSISMAFNVISCKKVERNTQKLKIADFTM